jgi:nucleotide-binding universal stress UspA family protein
MAGRIVVGIDGSEDGRHALDWAAAEARVRDARLTVVHAWLPPQPISSFGPMIAPIDVSEFEVSARAILDAELDALPRDVGVPVESVLARGYAPAMLLREAEGADLLVVGSRGRGGFKGLLVGSVSQHCATHAVSPVAVVRPDAGLDGGDVVVGVDGSDGAQAALEFAVKEAHVRGARLVVAHAWWVEHPSSPDDVLIFASFNREDYVTRSRELIDDMLAKAHAAVGHRAVEVIVQPLEDAPARGLVALADDASVLVVGTRGRGGFKSLLLGSVSQQCLHHARGVVIVVPQPKP